MRAVNLLPRDAAQAKSIRNEDPAVVVGSVLGLIVVIVLAAGFLTAHTSASAEQKKLTAAQLELGKLSLHKRSTAPVKTPAQTRPIIPIPAVTSEEQPRLDAIVSAMSTRIAWDRILREFSLVVPDDVTIATLNMTAPSTTTDGTASTSSTQGLSLAGSAYSHDSVARLLSRLMLIPDLSDVTLASSTAATTGGLNVQFSISASVKGAPVPAASTTTTTPATTDTSSDTTTGASS
jgi:Tfp pilus assembly protein PilN